MNHYMLIHNNKYGTDTYPFKSSKGFHRLPSYQEIAEKLALPYEPEKGEYLDLFQLNLETIPEI